jgi:hypothetical protein
VIDTVAGIVSEDPGEAKQVAIWGADDLEVGYSDGDAAENWAVGFLEGIVSEGGDSLYIDYGGAEGCPTSSHENGSCTGGESGWDQEREYALGYGLADAVAAPEIYYNPPPGSPVNAEQWAEIAVYAITHLEHSCMYFTGPLDEDEVKESNDSTQAWDQFYRVLKERVQEPFETWPPSFCGSGVLLMEDSLEI